MSLILPEQPTSTTSDIDLLRIQVRTTVDFSERRQWDTLMSAHHYLPYHGLFGKALRHIAYVDDQWLALLGWQAGAFKLGARDRWIGWNSEQQFSRLHLIANNVRFVILPQFHIRNLASRVLSLSLRRLSKDIEKAHGYPVVLAETFVDRRYFTGASYRAANFHSLGLTRGFERVPGGVARYRHHGHRKEIFMYALDRDAKRILTDTEAPEAKAEAVCEPLTTAEYASLYEMYLEAQDADYRSCHGRRYPLACVLTIATAARLAGYRGVTAFAEFGALLTQKQLQTIGAFYSPSRNCYTSPGTTTFHDILSRLPDWVIETIGGRWLHQRVTQGQGIAMDGKCIRGASKQLKDGCTTVAAVTHRRAGGVLGQVRVANGTNEITAVRELTGKLDLKGQILTADAIHTNAKTMQQWIDAGADYVLIVKANQEKVLADLIDTHWDDEKVRYFDSGVQSGHGRLERRRLWAVDVTDPLWDGYMDLPGRCQAMRIERWRETIKSNKQSTEIAYALTSLPAHRADAKQLNTLVREHWHIENSNHYVRDFTYDEDRCRARVRNMPQNLAALTNLAISIIRLQGKFDYIPQSNRYYAARTQEALDLILKPLPS